MLFNITDKNIILFHLKKKYIFILKIIIELKNESNNLFN